jgi:hypothetical protein
MEGKMSDVVKKLPAVNNAIHMGVGAASLAADKTGLIPGFRGVQHSNPLGQYLAPLALGYGAYGMAQSGSAMCTDGIGSLDQDGNSNAVNFAGATGATVAGGIGTAALGANIATGLGATGTVASSITTATTAGVATGSAGAGLATSVGTAGALPVAAAIGGGLAAGVTIGNGMNALADSDYNIYQDEEGRGTDDRNIDSYIESVRAEGGDPTEWQHVLAGGALGTLGQVKDVAGGAMGFIGSLFD